MDSGIFEFIYDTSGELCNKLYENKKLYNSFNYVNKENNKYAIRTTLNHYKALSVSKLLNYERILILEDDVRFLKDKSKLIEILELNLNSLNKYQMCLYDYISYGDVCLFADCYSLNKDGINILINNLEKKEKYIIDMYFSKLDTYKLYSGAGAVNVKNITPLDFVLCGNTRLCVQYKNEQYNEDIDYSKYYNQ